MTRLHRAALVAIGAVLATVAALTLGRAPERTVPAAAPPQATAPNDLSAALRRCAALEGDRIEEAGCMAVWEENRHRFFGGQARPHAPAAAPVMPSDPPAPTGSSWSHGTAPDTNRAPQARHPEGGAR